MKHRLTAFVVLLAFACLAFLNTNALGTRAAETIADTNVADFTLPDADGKSHTLASLKGEKGTALIFVSTQCPVSNGYNERMAKLAADYRTRGINVVGINANSTESTTDIGKHASEKGLSFVILKDDGNRIADLLGARTTPEVFLLDAANKVVYHGSIDNNRANNMADNAPDLRKHLGDAMDAVIAGKPVATPETRAFGCGIKRVAKN